jgi:hypothetical protein
MKPAMFLNMGVKPHLGSRQTLGSQVLEWGNNFKIVEILRQQLKKKVVKKTKEQTKQSGTAAELSPFIFKIPPGVAWFCCLLFPGWKSVDSRRSGT